MSEKNKKNTQKKQKKSGRIINTVILIAAIAVMVFALSKLIPILLDYKQSEDTYQDLIGAVVDLGENLDTEESADEEGYDWASVRIDFDSLKAINTDVIGWIRFDDTTAVGADYPILHGETNNTYLRTNLYGEYYIAGSIFLEAANSPDFSDYYNIIYGHNMKNDTMFGSLKKYKNVDGFYEENQFFTIYTETAAYRYQIFSCEEVLDDSVIYTGGYAPDETYQSLIDTMVSGSLLDTGITPDCNDRIVTLTTCTSTGDHYRLVLHAVLVDQVEY